MKIGYTASLEEVSKLKEEGANQVVLGDDYKETVQSFYDFIVENEDNEIVLVSIFSVGSTVTLMQLHDSVRLMREKEYSVTFLEKGIASGISNEDYLTYLWYLISNEKKAVITRTQNGMEKARDRGLTGGRPTLDQEIIDSIVTLHRRDKRTIRDIANIVDVSIGSVHKYIQQYYRTNQKAMNH